MNKDISPIYLLVFDHDALVLWLGEEEAGRSKQKDTVRCLWREQMGKNHAGYIFRGAREILCKCGPGPAELVNPSW